MRDLGEEGGLHIVPAAVDVALGKGGLEGRQRVAQGQQGSVAVDSDGIDVGVAHQGAGCRIRESWSMASPRSGPGCRSASGMMAKRPSLSAARLRTRGVLRSSSSVVPLATVAR